MQPWRYALRALGNACYWAKTEQHCDSAVRTTSPICWMEREREDLNIQNMEGRGRIYVYGRRPVRTLVTHVIRTGLLAYSPPYPGRDRAIVWGFTSNTILQKMKRTHASGLLSSSVILSAVSFGCIHRWFPASLFGFSACHVDSGLAVYMYCLRCEASSNFAMIAMGSPLKSGTLIDYLTCS